MTDPEIAKTHAKRTEHGSHSAGRPPAPFVVGVPRSGTTLLRMMLDAHSTLAIPQETNFGPAMVAFEKEGVKPAIEAIVQSELWGDYNLPAEEFTRRVESRRPTAFGEVMRAFYELYAEKMGKSRWGNKTPYYLARMDLIQEMLPEARFVHIVRDGRDVALSTVPVWFGPSHIADLAREWSWWLKKARRQAGDLRFYIEIRYEDLVRDPSASLRRICEFLELEWEPSMLDYHRDAGQKLSAELRDVYGDGRLISREERLEIHRLVPYPPQLDRVERWRREMSAADLDTFDAVAAEMLQAFGYELT